MGLREICMRRTTLCQDEIACLERLEAAMPVVAALTGSDIFIDVYDFGRDAAVVAAQARPEAGSRYEKNVAGLPALRSDEPAVYHALEQGTVVRDLKAVTQEGCVVRQDVAPVFHGEKLIGVMIRERDISDRVRQRKKYDALVRRLEQREKNVPGVVLRPLGRDGGDKAREVDHRIKNSLQLIANLFNIQAGMAQDPELRRVFVENSGRVMAIAATHDLICSPTSGCVLKLLEQLAEHLQRLSASDQKITISVSGDDFPLEAGESASVALVVHELAGNAVQHAFAGRAEGTVRIIVYRGKLYSSVLVEDDGCGFPGEAEKQAAGLGLRLVRRIVRDRLGGTLRIESSPSGTRAAFDFEMKDAAAGGGSGSAPR